MGIVTAVNFKKILDNVARLIEEGDSFEGNISYTRMTSGLERDEFEVFMAARVGNRDGQGGMTIIEASPLNEHGVIIGREEVHARQQREMAEAFGNSPPV